MDSYSNNNRMAAGSFIAFISGMLVWAWFGPKIKQTLRANKTWVQMKNEVYSQAKKVTDLTEEKYYEIVDQVSEKYSLVKDISQNELKDLVEDLKIHWARIKDRMNQESSTHDRTKLSETDESKVFNFDPSDRFDEDMRN